MSTEIRETVWAGRRTACLQLDSAPSGATDRKSVGDRPTNGALALWLFIVLFSSPHVADPGPHGEQPGDEQAERYRHLFEQLHDDAGLSTFRLPVCRLQRPVVVLVQEEQRLAAGHRLEHLEHQRRGGALGHYLLLPKG